MNNTNSKHKSSKIYETEALTIFLQTYLVCRALKSYKYRLLNAQGRIHGIEEIFNNVQERIEMQNDLVFIMRQKGGESSSQRVDDDDAMRRKATGLKDFDILDDLKTI